MYLSIDHPRGADLERLLRAGAQHAKAFAGRQKRGADKAEPEVEQKRFRARDMYALVVTTGMRSVDEVMALAEENAQKGPWVFLCIF